MVPSIVKPGLRLACGCLSLGLLILLVGCKGSSRGAQHAEVTGKVTFKGKPLPGGRISFADLKKGFASTGVIDESGNYQIKAPVGEMKISVDNSMLEQRRFGGGAPKMQHPKPPGSETDEAPIKGQYVNLPSQYRDPAASGLSYTVKPGSQTHDIDLSDSPPPASGK